MTESVPLVITAGQNEGIDPKLLPAPQLTEALNIRQTRDGRWRKRYGMEPRPNTTIVGSGADKLFNWVGELGGQRLVIAGSLLRHYPEILEKFKNESTIPRFYPEESTQLYASVVTSPNAGATAHVNGYTVRVYAREGIETVIAIYDLNETPLAEQVITSGFYRSRAIVCGHIIIILTDEGGTVQARHWDTFNDPFSASPFSAPTALGATTSDFDAVAVSATQFVLVRQNLGTQITTSLLNLSYSVLGSVTETLSASTYYIGVGRSDNHIYVAWSGNSVCQCRVTNLSLVPVTTAVTLAASGADTGRPGVAQESANVVRVVWSGGAGARIEHRTVNSAAALGTVYTQHGVNKASQPFRTGGHTYVFTLKLAVDQRQIFMIRLTEANDGSQLQLRYLGGKSVAPTFSSLYQTTPVLCGNVWSYNVEGNISPAYVGGGVTNGTIVALRFVESTTVSRAHRGAVSFDGTLLVPGGFPWLYDGQTFAELGFAQLPEIISLAGTTIGAMTSSATYLYRVVWSWVDRFGNEYRSAPSVPMSVTTGGSDNAVTVTLRRVPFTGKRRAYVEVYRTQAGGSIYNLAAVRLCLPGSGNVVFNDIRSDSAIQGSALLYTQAGQLPNEPAPSCRGMFVNDDRVWCWGLDDKRLAHASKPVLFGEGTSFTSDGGFFVRLPEPITGGAGLDGSAVFFSRRGIWVVSGDGPDASGFGSFSPARRIPSNVGCIDYRSILVTQDGIIFQSHLGLYLLPRGFGAPMFIGQGVQNTLESFPHITGATLYERDGETLAKFTVVDNDTAAPTAGRVLNWDLQRKQWSVDSVSSLSGPPFGACGIWGDRFVALAHNVIANALFIERDTGHSDGEGTLTNFWSLTTGDIRIGGPTGWANVYKIGVLAEYRGTCTLVAEASYDGGATWPDVGTWPLDPTTVPGIAVGDQVIRELTLDRVKSERIRIRVREAAPLSNNPNTEGVIINALHLEVEPSDRKLAPLRSAFTQ
jgi:hypothetical protein